MTKKKYYFAAIATAIKCFTVLGQSQMLASHWFPWQRHTKNLKIFSTILGFFKRQWSKKLTQRTTPQSHVSHLIATAVAKL